MNLARSKRQRFFRARPIRYVITSAHFSVLSCARRREIKRRGGEREGREGWVGEEEDGPESYQRGIFLSPSSSSTTRTTAAVITRLVDETFSMICGGERAFPREKEEYAERRMRWLRGIIEVSDDNVFNGG